MVLPLLPPVHLPVLECLEGLIQNLKCRHGQHLNAIAQGVKVTWIEMGTDLLNGQELLDDGVIHFLLIDLLQTKERIYQEPTRVSSQSQLLVCLSVCLSIYYPLALPYPYGLSCCPPTWIVEWSAIMTHE